MSADDEVERLDAPNQQVVRGDGSGPADEGEGGSTAPEPAPETKGKGKAKADPEPAADDEVDEGNADEGE